MLCETAGAIRTFICTMHLIYSFLILTAMTTSALAQNDPIRHIDLERYAGKWYSLASIPTLMDKNWRETIENYTRREDGDYDVVTTYKKGEDEEIHEISSKLKQDDDAPESGEMTAQFFWILRPAYRVIALADDYSWVVVGHPKKKYLFIMSRKPEMAQTLYDSLVEKCRAAGYAVSELRSQQHKPGIH